MKKIFLLFTAFVLIVGYNNCAGRHDSPGNRAWNAASIATCEAELMANFKSSVYSFVRSPDACVSCHVDGGQGLGAFASADVDRAYANFSAAGLQKISSQATSPAHKAPYTGVHHKPTIDALNETWPEAEAGYVDCLAKAQGGGVDESLLTAAKGASAIYTNQTVQTISWDLDVPADLDGKATRTLPAKLSISVKVLYQVIGGVNRAKGYIFSDPTLQMKDPSQQVVVEGVYVHINETLISSQTAFINVSRVVSGTQAMLLMNGDGNTIIDPVATTDTFSIYLRRAMLTSATDDSVPPLVPLLSVTDSETGSKTLLKSRTAPISILRDSGVVRWCLTESLTPPASTEAPCPYPDAPTDPKLVVNGWFITRPTSFTFSAGDGNKRLYLWVANDSLLMNETPATVAVTVDTTAPAPATISGLTSTDTQDTQVANFAISNTPDITGWCVWEQNIVEVAPDKPELDDPCWDWSYDGTKPDSVGYRGNGNRDVWVFVRDAAGNISDASNKLTGNNPWGPVTFAQLTGPASDARAVFTNNCYTCHATISNPGYQKLRLFDYNAAIGVAESGALVARTNNPLSPMPNINGGLMAKKYRDMIRLWVTPEGGGDPEP